ncbi:hypothetical protein D3C73_1372860 [compost metagenome]
MKILYKPAGINEYAGTTTITPSAANHSCIIASISSFSLNTHSGASPFCVNFTVQDSQPEQGLIL